MTLGYLQFASVVWLWALPVAVGIPLMAHLLKRRGGRVVVFPTIRFLVEAAGYQSRQTRPVNLLLLVLRVAILAMIVAAFARPVWYTHTPPPWAGQGVVMALVLDRSASMRCPYRGATLLDHAKQQVIDALNRLDPQRDSATVVLLDASPSPLLPEPSANFSKLVSLIRQTTPTYEHGDLDAAISVAADQLDRATVLPTRVVTETSSARTAAIRLYTDAQATMITNGLANRFALKNIPLQVHRVGNDMPNLAIYEPMMNPVRPIVGQPATVTVSVANYHTQTRDTTPQREHVTVHMNYRGESQTQTIAVLPNAVGLVNFAILPQSPGPTSVDLFIEPDVTIDTFSPDNRTGLSFTVAQSRKVTLITRADSNNPHTAAYYVARALVPATSDDVVQSNIELLIQSLDRLSDTKASIGINATARPAAIVIVEAGRLNPDQLEQLHRYVIAGGAVVWVIDSLDALLALQHFARHDPQSISSPISPRHINPWLTNATTTLAPPVLLDDPLMRVFEGPSRAGLARLTFKSRVIGNTTPGVQPLLTFDDGLPALACRWFGAGRLAIFAADLSPTSSDMVKGPLFVPLLHQLVRGLSPGPPAQLHPHPGDKPTLTLDNVDADQHLTARGPNGEPIELSPISTTPKQAVVQLKRITLPGLYEITTEEHNSPIASIYAELDPRESDLRSAVTPTVPAHASYTDRTNGIATDAGDSRETLPAQSVPLWPHAIVLAMILIAAESIVLMWMNRSQATPQNEAIAHA